MTAGERALRADAVRNYERLVSAAVEAFEELGPEVTLEQIAERARVSVMTLYRRFGSRDQLIRAVFHHVVAAEIEPMAAVRTDDPWRDLTGALEAVVDVIARRQVVHSLSFEFRAFAAESGERFLHAMEPVVRRAVEAGVVRPELEVWDAVAVVVMTTATIHPADPSGAARRRCFALLLEGLRPSATTLPPLPPGGFAGEAGPPACD